MQQQTNLSYASIIGVMKNTLKSKKVLEQEVLQLNQKLVESQTLYLRM